VEGKLLWGRLEETSSAEKLGCFALFVEGFSVLRGGEGKQQGESGDVTIEVSFGQVASGAPPRTDGRPQAVLKKRVGQQCSR
jgi:hypothetical protein